VPVARTLQPEVRLEHLGEAVDERAVDGRGWELQGSIPAAGVVHPTVELVLAEVSPQQRVGVLGADDTHRLAPVLSRPKRVPGVEGRTHSRESGGTGSHFQNSPRSVSPPSMVGDGAGPAVVVVVVVVVVGAVETVGVAACLATVKGGARLVGGHFSNGGWWVVAV